MLTAHRISCFSDQGRRALESAHRLLFALAFNNVFSSNISNLEGVSGTVKGNINADAVVRPLVIVFEWCLSLAAASTMLFLSICWERGSELRKDPVSIDSVLGITRNDF